MAKAKLTMKQRKSLLSKGRKSTAMSKTGKSALLHKRLNRTSGIARSGIRHK